MTMPFRFAPGCCNPCNTCGIPYTPEQFTVVSGTYDVATHMLSPGGVLTVPYTGTHPYFIYAKKFEAKQGGMPGYDAIPAEVMYIFGDFPFRFTDSGITHGEDISCPCPARKSTTEDIIWCAYPVHHQHTNVCGYLEITPEGFYTVFGSFNYLESNTEAIFRNVKFSENLPRIRNDSDSDVRVDQIVLEEYKPDCLEYYRCKHALFDGVDEITVDISGSGAVLRKLNGSHVLKLNNCDKSCVYKKLVTISEVFHVPMFRDEFVCNLDQFAYPGDIEWVPFTLELNGMISLVPRLAARYDSDTGYYIGEGFGLGFTLDSRIHQFLANETQCFRYVKCPSASAAWKNLDEICGLSLMQSCDSCFHHCWDVYQYYQGLNLVKWCKNAQFQQSNHFLDFYGSTKCNMLRLLLICQGCLTPDDIDIDAGTSQSISPAVGCYTDSYHTHFQVKFDDSTIINGGVGPSFSQKIIGHPYDEPCAESYKTCPYVNGITFGSQGGTLQPYFTGKSIAATITGVNRVL